MGNTVRIKNDKTGQVLNCGLDQVDFFTAQGYRVLSETVASWVTIPLTHGKIYSLPEAARVLTNGADLLVSMASPTSDPKGFTEVQVVKPDEPSEPQTIEAGADDAELGAQTDEPTDKAEGGEPEEFPKP